MGHQSLLIDITISSYGFEEIFLEGFNTGQSYLDAVTMGALLGFFFARPVKSSPQTWRQQHGHVAVVQRAEGATLGQGSSQSGGPRPSQPGHQHCAGSILVYWIFHAFDLALQ